MPSLTDFQYELNPGMQSWSEGFYECVKRNTTFPSAAILKKGGNTDTLKEIEELLPIWIYAFQVEDPSKYGYGK